MIVPVGQLVRADPPIVRTIQAGMQNTNGTMEEVQHTQCCIVGAGPAGMLLALLLARQGIAVTLLEAQHDFDRPFRGNTLNPAVLDIMRQLGLLDQLLALRHACIEHFVVHTDTGPLAFADFTRLRTTTPYVLMLPQASFLQLLLDETQRYPNFRLVLGARVEELIENNGTMHGVRYRGVDGWHDLLAPLTIGADGRFSRVRRLAHLELISTAAPLDVLWFMLPRAAADPDDAGASFRFGVRSLLVLMDHWDHWQIGYILPKGGYAALKAQGIAAFQRNIAVIAPELADRVGQLTDWKHCSLLSVESSRARCWHRPGLLLIGDAAHVMSPVGGVGINLAIQDAVAAANVVAAPLATGHVLLSVLARVQQQREWPTRVIQGAQAFAQQVVVARALQSDQPFRFPLPLRVALRVPWLQRVPSHLIAYGVGSTTVVANALCDAYPYAASS